MKRVLNRWDSMFLSIGVVIGIGIFRVPSEIANYLHCNSPLILLVWLVGGIVSFMGALCYAELASLFPETGGDYVFLRQTYGRAIAFMYAWTELLIIRTGSIAAISFLFADYACGLFSVPKSMDKLLAIACILIVSILNLFGLNWIKKTQNALTITKLLAIILLIICGLVYGKGDLSRLATSQQLSIDWTLLSSFALALIPVLWTYGGWQESTFVAGETIDPFKSLPFALLGSVLVSSVIYLSLNAFFLYIMPADKLVSSHLIAADVLSVVPGNFGGKLMALLVMLYALGSINVMIITGSRITYSMAGNVKMFKFFSTTWSENTVPLTAILLNAIGACVFVILGNFERLLFFTGIVVWLFFALVISGLFILRRRKLHRPFSVPFYPWLPACFLLICIGLCLNTLITYTQQSIIGLCLAATGLPVFYLSEYLIGKGVFKQKE